MNSRQKDIKVSVYCLTYNHEKYIRKTLEGFVGQITDFDFEVWVHDDASTDHTADIIREYVDRYPSLIKPIYQKENQYSKGIGITRTYIYPKMQGKYIASCEGDDYWTDPYKLQKQFNALEAHPECSLSTHKVQYCNEDGSFNTSVIPALKYHIHETGVISKRELAQYYFLRGAYLFQTSSYFYRREIVDMKFEYPYDQGILRKCFALGSVYYLDELMSVYRQWTVGSWTSRRRSEGISVSWNHVIRLNDFNDDFDRYTDYIYRDYIEAEKIRKFTVFARYQEYRCEGKKILLKYGLTPWKVRKVLPVDVFINLEIKYVLAMHFAGICSIFYSCARKLYRLTIGRNLK